MQVSGLSFLFIGFRLVLAGSAYDNPEQDVLYSQAVLDEGGDLDWSKEKLEQRWGIDVCFSSPPNLPFQVNVSPFEVS